MKCITMSLITITGLLLSGALYAATHDLPQEWQGYEKGETKGNPVKVDDKPRWRFDQVMGDDPLSGDHELMVWGGRNWVGPKEFGGQPSISVNRSTVELAARGSWGGSGNTKGMKIPALMFIAPDAGTYTLNGTAQAQVWKGSKAAELVVIKRDADGNTTKVASLELAKDKDPVVLEDISVELKADEELGVLAVMRHNYHAANVKLRNVKIECGTTEDSQK